MHRIFKLYTLSTCISFLIDCSIKPTLKKVSKYENKFAKLQKKAAEFNFRNQLKTVKKKEFAMEDVDEGVSNHFISIQRPIYFWHIILKHNIFIMTLLTSRYLFIGTRKYPRWNKEIV